MELPSLKKNLKLLIFWEETKEIESNINQILTLAKSYYKHISIIFISNIDNFLKKKAFLQENNLFGNNNSAFIFDDKFLFNKYYVIKIPWFVILNKDNEIFDSGILRLEELQEKIDNFLGENPESRQNISNLFWIDLSNKIKINLVRKINIELAKKNYKNIYFYIETNSSIANENLKSTFDIDAYFVGNLKYQDFNVFKEIAEKICKEEKIKNIHFNLEKQ